MKDRLTDEVRLESVTFDLLEQVEVCPGKERNEGSAARLSTCVCGWVCVRVCVPSGKGKVRLQAQIKKVEDLKYLGSEFSATQSVEKKNCANTLERVEESFRGYE